MRIIIIFIVIVFIGAASYSLYSKYKKEPLPATTSLQNDEADSSQEMMPLKEKSIFVPYWEDFSEKSLSVDQYDELIYFGITPTSTRINKNEQGYEKIEDFLEAAPVGKKKYLAVRMTNQDLNVQILENRVNWDTIVQDTLDIAENYKFDGVVLDLEFGVLPFKDMTAKVTEFVDFFATNTKGRNMTFAITTYGDTIFRRRPYDLTQLSKSADKIYIMAYDLHKTKGLPGPNFPLHGKETYGYDFETMTTDMTKRVSPQKLVVVFGMYGYDWLVDEKKRPFAPAKALTYLEIKEKFLNGCTLKNCVVQRDPTTAETEINYVDDQAFSQPNIVGLHIIWFEDQESVAKKMMVLQKVGIDKISYWAYGYF